jgi:YgiT-type zinc finger domain-containing protein
MKKGMKCVCGETAKYVKHLRFNSHDIDGWKCDSCGEEYYNPEKAERILLLNKLKKHKYYLKLSQTKSNLILRIPKEIGEVLNLRKGAEVEFGLRDSNEIIIHPVESTNL